MPGNISIPDQEGNMMTIKREEPSSVNESLGIQLTLTGDQSKQKEVLKEKSEVFATQIEQGNVIKQQPYGLLRIVFFHQ